MALRGDALITQRGLDGAVACAGMGVIEPVPMHRLGPSRGHKIRQDRISRPFADHQIKTLRMIGAGQGAQPHFIAPTGGCAHLINAVIQNHNGDHRPHGGGGHKRGIIAEAKITADPI